MSREMLQKEPTDGNIDVTLILLLVTVNPSATMKSCVPKH